MNPGRTKSGLASILASNYFDLGTSVLTLLIFIVPVVIHRLKGEPSKT